MAEKGYIFKVLAHASFGKMKTAIKAVHEKSGKNSIKIFFDMLWCASDTAQVIMIIRFLRSIISTRNSARLS